MPADGSSEKLVTRADLDAEAKRQADIADTIELCSRGGTDGKKT